MLQEHFYGLSKNIRDAIDLYEYGALTEEELYQQLRLLVAEMRATLQFDDSDNLSAYPPPYTPPPSSQITTRAKIVSETARTLPHDLSETDSHSADSADNLRRYYEIMAQAADLKKDLKTLDVREFKDFLSEDKSRKK